MKADILDDLEDSNDFEQGEGSSPAHQSGEQMPLSDECPLLTDTVFLEHMRIIGQLVDSKIRAGRLQGTQDESTLVHKSNQYASTISQHIATIFRTVKSIYYHKFPQLESIVTNPPQYCRTVRQIERNIHSFNHLTSHQRMSLQIALSSEHPPLTSPQQLEVLTLTDRAVLLQEHHNLLMMYLESTMQVVAPNLCQLVGSLVASKLISAAGGVRELAAMPACNIQVMGSQRAAQIGLSMMERNHTGIFGHMDLVKDAPKRFQMQLVRMLASNTAKCARADILQANKTLGEKLRDELYERFQKIQEEGGLMRVDQPLPVPDQAPAKKRGGKRYRKQKQLMEMTQLRKQQNRMKFGQEAEDEAGDGVGLGMLLNGSGRLKVPIQKRKMAVSKKTNARMNKTSGLQSSVNLSSKQGIELINPSQQQQQGQNTSGKESVFSKSAGFHTVLNNKFGAYK